MTRHFQGFAVVAAPDGPLIWGTLRPNRADAWAAYRRHNPALPDHPAPGEVVAVEIVLHPLPRG